MENVDMSKMYPGYDPAAGFTGAVAAAPEVADAEFEEVVPDEGSIAPQPGNATSVVTNVYVDVRLGILRVAMVEDLAALLGVSIQTLANWRKNKQGPSFFNMGKKVVYKLDDVWEWLDKFETVVGGPVAKAGGVKVKSQTLDEIFTEEEAKKLKAAQEADAAIRANAGNVQAAAGPVADLGRLDATDPVTALATPLAGAMEGVTLGDMLAPEAAAQMHKYMRSEEEQAEIAAAAETAARPRREYILPDIDAMEFEDNSDFDTSSAEIG